jgi:DNA-binding CsgD family transcriptional regulator
MTTDMQVRSSLAMPTGWGERGDVATVLEALYRVDLPEPEWLDGLWRSFAPLVPGSQVVLAGRQEWTPGAGGLRMPVLRGSDEALVLRAVTTSHRAEAEFVDATAGSSRRVYTFHTVFGERLARMNVSQELATFQGDDALVLQGHVHAGLPMRVTLFAIAGDRVDVTPATARTWDRLATHLAAATRLRYGEIDAVEGVLSPDGTVLHAEGPARGAASREALGRAVVAIDRARRDRTRTDPQTLLEAWRAIVERRWSLVDVVESDGRRFMLARVNPPESAPDADLTPREREVAALVAQGVPQKSIGYELELSPSTVAFHVRNIGKKRGAASSTALVGALAKGRPSPPPVRRRRGPSS